MPPVMFVKARVHQVLHWVECILIIVVSATEGLVQVLQRGSARACLAHIQITVLSHMTYGHLSSTLYIQIVSSCTLASSCRDEFIHWHRIHRHYYTLKEDVLFWHRLTPCHVVGH